MAKPADPGQLSERAWSLVSEALQEGTMTLGNGSTRPMETREIVRLVQWLATLRAKKPKIVADPADFNLKKTET